MARVLFVLDRFPFPANDGELIPFAAHAEALATTSSVDLLLIRRASSEPSPGVRAGSPFDRIDEVAAPPAPGPMHRALGEVLRRKAFYEVPVACVPEVRRKLEGRCYDAIYVGLPRLAEWGRQVASLLSPRPRASLVVNDAVTERLRYHLHLARRPLRWGARAANLLRGARSLYFSAIERGHYAGYDQLLVQSSEDREAIRRDCGDEWAARAAVVPNGAKEELFDLEYSGARARALLSFGMKGAERLDLVHWFIRNVFLHVRRRLDDVTLHVVGAGPEAASLADYPGVVCRGFAPSLGEVFSGATISIAPMFMRGGILNKVLDSMAAGVPCVGAGAFGGIPGFVSGIHGFEVGGTKVRTWRETLLRLLENPELLERASREGRALLRRELTWARSAHALYETVLGHPSSEVE